MPSPALVERSHTVRGMTMLEERPALTVAEWEQFHRREAARVLDGMDWPSPLTKADVWEHGFPHEGLHPEVNRWRAANLPNLRRGLRTRQIAAKYGIPTMFGALFIRVFKFDGEVLDYGLASMRVVTDTGVGYIVDAFQNIVEAENQKFHGLGTGTGAEAAGDSALGTELTTEYNPNSTRATGTTTEGASANIYRTVATNTIDSGTPAVTEHGIFSASSAGVLLDRSKFTAINLVANDGIQTTYDLTFTSGG